MSRDPDSKKPHHLAELSPSFKETHLHIQIGPISLHSKNHCAPIFVGDTQEDFCLKERLIIPIISHILFGIISHVYSI